MDNEKNLNTTEPSMEKTLQVEQILEFYKDKLDDTQSTQNEPTLPEKKYEIIKSLFLKAVLKVPFLKEKLKTNKTTEDIQNHSYGLSEKGRVILYRAMSVCISLLIITLSFTLAFFLPGNDDVYKSQLQKLRSDKDYVSLKSRYDTLKTEVEELKTSNSEKLSQIESIADIDNTKAKLRTQITEKTYELNSLNAAITSKRTEIESLDKEISSKAAPETIRTPGKYIVGKTIAAGRYHVTGTGKFMVATASGRSKINTTLKNTPLEVTLSTNDIVKFDSKVKFTALN